MGDGGGADSWAEAFTVVLQHSHRRSITQLTVTVDQAVRRLGLTARMLMVDLAQRALHPVPGGAGPPIAVEGTVAGRAYQRTDTVTGIDDDDPDTRVWWVPMVDGTERIGVLRIALAPHVVDDETLHRRVRALAGLLGHVLITKLGSSVELQQLRAAGLSAASELMWQLLGPRTFATDRVVISALLEPTEQVAGDAYDYAVDTGVEVAVFDGVGHDLMAGISTTLAVTAIRNARRRQVVDLDGQASYADEVLRGQPGPLRFVTAVLARLDTDTGELSYLLAGHPAPLLIRGGRVVKELAHPPRPPLGISGPSVQMPTDLIAHEQLQPGDAVFVAEWHIVLRRRVTGRALSGRPASARVVR